jgi:lipoyl(octanoyl) transferase
VLILAPGDIRVIPVDRGGQVTYHGPGQLVVYLLLDLTRRKLGVRALDDAIEQAIVECLGGSAIDASPRPNAPGVYVGDAKIASLGLRIRRGCSFHGLALNVDMDMEPFARINPCGHAGMPMCQVRDYVPHVDIHTISERLSDALLDKLGVQVVSRVKGW